MWLGHIEVTVKGGRMSQGLHIIVGLGVTAFSCARYLSERQIPFAVIDTRLQPPQLEAFKTLYPAVDIVLGAMDEALLSQASLLVMSPGVSIKEPAIARQIARGIPAIGDVELFVREAKAPIIAITGTNAKSTVTTLVGLMAEEAGLNVKVGGNLGVPALDLLDSLADLYVLELSSFQLETTHSLCAKVATVLNVTPDHMDRYDSVAAYQAAKLKIYQGADTIVCNADDALTDGNTGAQKFQFTLNTPGAQQFGIRNHDGLAYLAFAEEPLLAVKSLPVLGRHYQANALAALALGHGFGLPFAPMLKTLLAFKGLDHRCQFVREMNGVTWYNDSKGTNVGATLAALEGLGPEIEGKLILIAGGLGKNADFSPLSNPLQKYVRSLILIGEAAPLLAESLGAKVEEVRFADSMDAAVKCAALLAKPGDSVLLSPACASWDMFKNFEHRGQVFTEIVQGLL